MLDMQGVPGGPPSLPMITNQISNSNAVSEQGDVINPPEFNPIGLPDMNLPNTTPLSPPYIAGYTLVGLVGVLLIGGSMYVLYSSSSVSLSIHL